MNEFLLNFELVLLPCFLFVAMIIYGVRTAQRQVLERWERVDEHLRSIQQKSDNLSRSVATPRPHFQPIPKEENVRTGVDMAMLGPIQHGVTMVSEVHQSHFGQIVVHRTFEVVSGPYELMGHARRDKPMAWRAVERECDEKSQWDREFERQTGEIVDLGD